MMSPGDLVTPHLRLLRMLGHGGMGSVWVAEHLRLKTEVAVKFILGDYAKHPEALARFEREATLAAQAKSPHVVQVFDHGLTDDGVPYISMELLNGHDLASQIERDGKVEPRVFCEYFRQAAAGLGRAHQKGIVHRDVKPENIFLCDEDGDVLVKVLDFGVAKAETQSAGFSGTQTGAIMGTAYYMSPEQTMGKKDLDGRSDLWALGVVAYYALTGVRPFDGSAIGELVFAIAGSHPPPPSQLNAKLPLSLDGWMEKALAKVPAERFSSAKEMAAQLELALLGQERVRSLVPGAFVSGAAVAEPSSVIPSQTSAGVTQLGSVRAATTLSPATTYAQQPSDQQLPPEAGPKKMWWGAGIVAAVAVVGLVLSLRTPAAEPDELRSGDTPKPRQEMASEAGAQPGPAEQAFAGREVPAVAPQQGPQAQAAPADSTLAQKSGVKEKPEKGVQSSPASAATAVSSAPTPRSRPSTQPTLQGPPPLQSAAPKPSASPKPAAAEPVRPAAQPAPRPTSKPAAAPTPSPRNRLHMDIQ